MKTNKTTDNTEGSLSRQDALACIPVKNPQVQEEQFENGEIRLSYQVQVRPWFSGLFKKIANRESDIINRKLQLDALGRSVWHMIDGQRSVQGIISTFQADHQLTERESELSVTAFLKELGKRGLVLMKKVEDGRLD